jgi:tRNA-dihydrouridine synthase
MSSFWRRLARPITVLAPMEDVTDSVFRRIVARCGRPAVFFTEFTSTDGLCSPGHEAVAHRLVYTAEERPIVAQIWGTKPELHYRAAREVASMGFDGIDINMGCPVKKIVKGGGCAALIDNPSLAAEIIRATREGAGDLPVSVKTRCGTRRWRTEEWAAFLLEQKPEVLTMHGRIAREESKFPARWDEVAKVVRLRDQSGSDALILGNGDVQSLVEIEEKAALYGVDGVMVGRGIFETPYLFRDRSPQPWPAEERLALLLEHLDLYRETWGDRHYPRLKKFYKMYVGGFAGAAHLRVQIMETVSVGEAQDLVRRWLETHAAVAAP